NGVNKFHAQNVKAIGGSSYGINFAGTTTAQTHLHRVLVTGAATGIQYDSSRGLLSDCRVTACTTPGLYVGIYGITVHRCIFDSNTGGSTDGAFEDSSYASSWVNCIFYGNGRDGLRLTGSGGGVFAQIRNNIFYNNGGYGSNSQTTNF